MFNIKLSTDQILTLVSALGAIDSTYRGFAMQTTSEPAKKRWADQADSALALQVEIYLQHGEQLDAAYAKKEG